MCNSVYINRVYVCVSVGRLFLEKLKGTCLLFLASYFQPSSAFLLLSSDSITSVVKGTEVTSGLVLKEPYKCR